MEIKLNGSQAAYQGPADWFTGRVRVEPLLAVQPPSRLSGGMVTFEPGARTNWHAHPLGQTLIVTAGLGRVQSWGGPVQEIRPGDVVRFAPHERHWHGASPTTAVSHIALAEQHETLGNEWMERVTDEQYAG